MTMKPLRVLIVDDEIPLRQELRIFPWEDCDAVLAGEASNGAEALQLCEACAPDVVITDITMPVMDGITLIRELRKQYPKVQMILLTCHSDFHYVQEALRLGALEYILKVSMEEDELKQALDKVRAAMMKDRIAQESEKREQRMLQAALFSKLLHGQSVESSDWHPMGMDGEKSALLVRLMINVSHSAYLSVKQPIQQLLAEMERNDPSWLTWLTLREKEYFILIDAGQPSEFVMQTLGIAVQAMNDLIFRDCPLMNQHSAVHAIVSHPFKTKEDLASSLAHSTEWKDALFYDYAMESQVFTNHPMLLTDMTDKKAKEMNELLRKASWSTSALRDCLHGEFIHWSSKHRIKPEQLKERMLNWQVDWLKVQEGEELDGSGIAQLMEAQTLSQLVACVIRAINAVEQGRTRSRVEIRSAVQWIKDHMQEQISLPHIADQVGLSPHYVSKLFREETGSTVNQYILRLRMEKAVELLKHTNKKVYEIAEEVGIPSYRYFTVTFRNWTGVSPTDYKRHS
ncbi:response regulator transcription factor [Paenibacillus luteus]|uniref:response regulator transcription factor n=1 Tax=Paenibacillus luteus TaxID=2545753 RepID=UPI0011413676|nr:response regulator [Paenibacillus luteus]